MTDGYVQVPPDSSGARIDTTERINADQIAVDRQRVEIPDVVQVTGDQLAGMLIEQRVQNLLLAAGFNVKDDVDDLRDSVSSDAISIPFLDLTDAPTSYSGFAGYHVAVNADEDALEFVFTREVLTAARTYYVSTSGSNSNDGLSAGSAWLTLQRAWDVITSTLDVGGQTITVSVAAGTYTSRLTLDVPVTGGGFIVFQGNTATPSNVLISTTSTECISVSTDLGANAVFIEGFKFVTTTSGACIRHGGLGQLWYGSCDFGAAAAGTAVHIHCQALGALFVAYANYTISGSASAHFYAPTPGAEISASGLTITLTGSPVFSGAFAYSAGGYIEATGNTFTGATGASSTRYFVGGALGAVNSGGGGANYFPGNIAGSGGTTAGGGTYA